MIANVGRIWEAASKERGRPVLMHVSFDVEKATLTATNSYLAARVPCEVEDGDESGLIPADAIKTAAGKSLRIADGKATLKLPDGERTWPLLVGSKFPDVDKILADTPKADVRFGLNARLLNDLGNAMGADTVVALHPVHPLKGMLVTALPDTLGVLMPVRLPSNGVAPVTPDLSNDAAVLAGIEAAMSRINGRRGKKKAAQAFRDALKAATETAA